MRSTMIQWVELVSVRLRLETQKRKHELTESKPAKSCPAGCELAQLANMERGEDGEERGEEHGENEDRGEEDRLLALKRIDPTLWALQGLEDSDVSDLFSEENREACAKVARVDPAAPWPTPSMAL